MYLYFCVVFKPGQNIYRRNAIRALCVLYMLAAVNCTADFDFVSVDIKFHILMDETNERERRTNDGDLFEKVRKMMLGTCNDRRPYIDGTSPQRNPSRPTLLDAAVHIMPGTYTML